MSEKPVIFISHAEEDKQGALSIKKHLEDILRVEIFVSSDPDSIKIGDEWFPNLINKLEISKALFVLLTKHSLDSKWVWFEIGYFWRKKNLDKSVHIYPLYAPGIEIPNPLNMLQGKRLDDMNEMMSFAKSICKQLGIRVIEG
jgi:TIR domain